MREQSVNPAPSISRVSTKPAEKPFKPAHSRTLGNPSSVERFVFCETHQLLEPLMGPDPAATAAG